MSLCEGILLAFKKFLYIFIFFWGGGGLDTDKTFITIHLSEFYILKAQFCSVIKKRF